jgi:hypothetical protein
VGVQLTTKEEKLGFRHQKEEKGFNLERKRLNRKAK